MCKGVCGALFKIAAHKNGKNLGEVCTQWDAMRVIYLMSLSPNPGSCCLLLLLGSVLCTLPFPHSRSSWLPIRFQQWEELKEDWQAGQGETGLGSYLFLPCQHHPQSGSSSNWLQPPLFFLHSQTQPLQTPPRYQQQQVATLLLSSECPRTLTQNS